MKKIIDDKKTLVKDMLSGYAKAYSDRVTLLGENVLLRKEPKEKGKVAVIIGNGSGHEPGMIDLVGKGLFDANICGNIFTAPTPIDMMKAVRKVDNGAGVLILVSSHQGDILNAKMAIMLARSEGYDVRMVILWDDISSAPKETPTERRGSVGLFFPFKIICSAAEDGMGMDDLIKLAEKARDNTRSLSVAVSSGTHPQTGLKTFELPEDEIEVGMGVHGEAGSGRLKLCSAKKLTKFMLDKLVADAELEAGDKIMMLVNNSGATTRMELLIIFNDVADYFVDKNIKIVRSYVGTYVTTQESQGFTLAFCKAQDDFVKYYDYLVDSPIF